MQTALTQARYELLNGVRYTRNGDGGVALDIKRGQMFRLNPVGASILALVSKGSSELEIVDAIADEYGVTSKVVYDDVQEFLKFLEQHHLIASKQ